MKCWICGKEETNSDVKINVDSLIWAVRNHFDNVQNYAVESKKTLWYKRTAEQQMNIIRRERDERGSQNEVSNLASILGTDWQRLYTLARLARKWEQKRKWQYCFPAKDNAKKILEWLTAEVRSYAKEIDYINHKINQKAAKQKAA